MSTDYQLFTIRKQILKKKIMMVVGACIFLVAAAQALPLEQFSDNEVILKIVTVKYMLDLIL